MSTDHQVEALRQSTVRVAFCARAVRSFPSSKQKQHIMSGRTEGFISDTECEVLIETLGLRGA